MRNTYMKKKKKKIRFPRKRLPPPTKRFIDRKKEEDNITGSYWTGYKGTI